MFVSDSWKYFHIPSPSRLSKFIYNILHPCCCWLCFFCGLFRLCALSTLIINAPPWLRLRTRLTQECSGRFGDFHVYETPHHRCQPWKVKTKERDESIRRSNGDEIERRWENSFNNFSISGAIELKNIFTRLLLLAMIIRHNRETYWNSRTILVSEQFSSDNYLACLSATFYYCDVG